MKQQRTLTMALMTLCLSACLMPSGEPPSEPIDDLTLRNGDPCDPGIFYARCEGNTLLTCEESIIVSWACGDSVCNAQSADCGYCGNGELDPGEQCDDVNITEGDGCDTNCTITACGNGILTTGEECDDGNLTGGGGCNAYCDFEYYETEPNNNIEQANHTFTNSRQGSIGLVGDHDFVSISLPGPSSTLRVQVMEMIGAEVTCESNAIDSTVELFNVGGVSLGFNDDSNGNRCSDLIVGGLAAGTYYIDIGAYMNGSTFPYHYYVTHQ